jgi:hypothetical protein
MNLIIAISQEGEVSLFLEKNKKRIASLVWKDKKDLMEKLLPNIEKFLKQEKIKPQDLVTVKVSSEIEKNCSTSRIAIAQAKALNYCLEGTKI